MKKVIIFLIFAIGILALGDAGRILLNEKKMTSQIKVLKTEISGLEEQKKTNVESMGILEKENEVLRTELAEELANKKVVYLTFDDGPTPQNTEKILEILRKNNIKATFFVIGHNSDMYKKIVDEGHAIALHTYSHNYKEVYASEEAFFKDLYKISDLVKDNTGVVSKVTRFPGGSLNAGVPSAIMKKIMIRLRDEGYVYQDWNCDSTDASQNGRPVPLIIENATVKCPYKHVNLLMHDSVLKVTTVQALQQIIDYYKSRGYLFETLETYSPKFQHKKLEDIK